MEDSVPLIAAQGRLEQAAPPLQGRLEDLIARRALDRARRGGDHLYQQLRTAAAPCTSASGSASRPDASSCAARARNCRLDVDVHYGHSDEALIAQHVDRVKSEAQGDHRQCASTSITEGTRPGFNVVHTIVPDDRGRVSVGDRENRRVQIFDTEGKFLQQWTHVGSPWGLDLTADRKHILLADGYNNRVLLLDLEGQIQGSLGGFGHAAGEFIHAHAIAAAANGDFYVAAAENFARAEVRKALA